MHLFAYSILIWMSHKMKLFMGVPGLSVSRRLFRVDITVFLSNTYITRNYHINNK